MAGVYAAAALVIVLLLYLSARVSVWLAGRAVCQVIGIFRSFGAVEPTKARTLQELGLVRPMFTVLRDYKPWALQTLVQAGVVRVVLDDMFYLSEEKLQETGSLTTRCGLAGIESGKLELR